MYVIYLLHYTVFCQLLLWDFLQQIHFVNFSLQIQFKENDIFCHETVITAHSPGVVVCSAVFRKLFYEHNLSVLQ